MGIYVISKARASDQIFYSRAVQDVAKKKKKLAGKKGDDVTKKKYQLLNQLAKSESIKKNTKDRENMTG